MSTRILLEKYEDINYALVFLTTNSLTPFVCTWCPTYREDGTIDRWGQGHYFANLRNAIAYIESKRVDEKIDLKINSIIDHPLVREHILCEMSIEELKQNMMTMLSHSNINSNWQAAYELVKRGMFNCYTYEAECFIDLVVETRKPFSELISEMELSSWDIYCEIVAEEILKIIDEAGGLI